MNILSMILSGLLGMLLIGFTVLLAVAIVFNLNAGKRYRESLALELEKLRLGKMLNALGINVSTYLHNERVIDIQQQMNRCNACSNTDTCDENMSTGAIDAGNIEFCNNEQSLQEILDKKPPVNQTSQ